MVQGVTVLGFGDSRVWRRTWALGAAVEGLQVRVEFGFRV